MTTSKEIEKFINKTKELEKGHQLDLSSGEDLSIAIMNLIGIEEHMFFTSQKLGDTKYIDILNTAREMRKELMKKIVKEGQGEVWCTSKHLLSASMRLMEVGTKSLTKGDQKEANDYFKKSFDLYNLFWGLNLGLIKSDSKKIKFEEKAIPEKSLMGTISQTIGKILDCCRE
ncbi:MAG: hypothetical protein PHN66_03925 [Candidatus Shapirobacteria bacterium]|jgi:hypothetical protein|nr:hypothetical protein [Candidatus Shapirobacteria bacterium]